MSDVPSDRTDPMPDEHVFRLSGSILIEWPDLPLPAGVRGGRRVATVWPERLSPTGWGVAVWEPCDRGWWVPAHLTDCAVVEFDSWWYASGRTEPRRTTWYGWVRSVLPAGLVVVGPYVDPLAAVEDGEAVAERHRRELLDLYRARSPT